MNETPSTPQDPTAPTTEAVKPAVPTKPKHAGGAPKKITKQMAEQITLLLAHGLTEEQVGEVLHINKVTIFRAKQQREFCNAVLQSKGTADAEVVKSLYLRAVGYSHPEEKVFCTDGKITVHRTIKHYPPDVGAITLWLINRQRADWRKEIQHEENRPGTKPPMIRLFQKIDGKEAAVIKQNGNQMDVLLGPDFVAQVKQEDHGTPADRR